MHNEYQKPDIEIIYVDEILTTSSESEDSMDGWEPLL